MRHAFLLPAVLALAACAAPQPPVSLPADAAAAWTGRQARLSRITHFRLQGRVAVKNGVEAWHLDVAWSQRGPEYVIDLSGPFGAGRVRLTGRNGGPVVLETADGRFTAAEPEQLLYEHTGVRMPVSGLRHWLLGLPGPGARPAALDGRGRLARLSRGGWEVRFRAYTLVDGLDLPRLITVERDGVRVRLVVDQWRLGLG